MTVARVPVYDGNGDEFSYFDLAPRKKGLAKPGKGTAGMFFPGRLPKPGESWLLGEGVKDPAALVGMGYLAAGMPGSSLSQKLRSCSPAAMSDSSTTSTRQVLRERRRPENGWLGSRHPSR